MRNTAQVTLRELRGYFGSPVAYLFMAAFLGVTLFVFFWVDTFFSRNVADIRPLFEWMPLLLIFLVAAITMRSWSEERRSGTLELLLTAPRSDLELVLGKFLGCLGLVAVAVLLTLPVPITVSLIGPLDWGPVVGGYVATLLLASAYISLGLFISSLTENQIVSLIGTLLVGLALYFIGAAALTDLASQPVADLLSSLGTGARFDSITRGVLDVRDLVYYLSLTLLFLTLNVLVLERQRWSSGGGSSHRRWRIATALVIANVLLLNLWLAPVRGLRADLTEGNIYSLSETTTTYLQQLREPLLIRGYFSKKTHPLLAPLVPQLKDLLHEYGVRGGRNVKVEIVDPQSDPKVAQEAASRYGIKPVPFRTQSKYESAVVNSYFNVLIQYGDEHKVLNFRDLIKIENRGGASVKVVLNDPEYRLTGAVKKVVSDYRRAGNVFSAIDKPVTLKAFISGKQRLPDALSTLRDGLDGIIGDLKKQAHGKLKVDIQDPGNPDSPAARSLAEQYGFQPLSTSLLGNDPFFFNLVLERGDQRVAISLPDDLKTAGLRKNLEAGLTRFARGLLNTVAVYSPSSPPSYPGMPPQGSHFDTLKKALGNNAVIRKTDLKSGHLPAGTDLLLVLDPHNLTDRQLFTIDQFMMRGGTTVMAASPFKISVGQQGLSASAQKTGLKKWLAQKGVHLDHSMVLDPVNARFPIPVTRNLGGIPIREYRQTDYPYFADIRDHQLAGDSVITHGLGQLTMTWASPIMLDKTLPEGLTAKTLIRSSEGAWQSSSTQIMPVGDNGEVSWKPSGQRGSKVLGTVISGRFDSYFKGKPNPLLAADDGKGKPQGAHGKAKKAALKVGSVIAHSPANTRLVLLSSGSFLTDTMMQLQELAAGQPYEQPVQLMRNTLDWALEDPALLALRDQTRTSRILQPLSDGERQFWEYLNYGLALLGLLVVFLIARGSRRRRERRYFNALNGEEV
ncbi:multi-copper enzyme maturation ABC transporter permease [Alcanivorax hongdengensis A-11-3]|uniref:Multi-copper enzyme maturation ABC transporter permease n=1 Tax=Alcanivorax hongdengensis A-11-3 TaxID=1177179 RepID=L0WG03_9GAMM|nr:Gldg family protein [Alcanivorax hongdengensis]EKF74755.1 multi-copper enzyme maturation ABC transporter permease [Alcanivorax hongdengensis A-11-3]